MLKKKSVMPWQAVIFLVLMPLLGSCAARHLSPSPVIGIDLQQMKKGDIANFDGTLMSPMYLNDYLQWKSNS